MINAGPPHFSAAAEVLEHGVDHGCAVDLALTVKGSAASSDAEVMRRIRLPASRLPLPAEQPRPASVIPDDARRAAERTRAAVEAVLENDGFDRGAPLIPQIRERLALAGA